MRIVNNSNWFKKITLATFMSCMIWFCISSFTMISCANAGTKKANKTDTLKLRNLFIVDESGKKRIELSVSDRGPSICFFDKQSKLRIEMILQNRKPSSVPSLNFVGLDGGHYMILQSICANRAGEYSSSLILAGTKGATASLSADKWAQLELSENRSGGASVEMMCVPQRGGVISTYDSNEKIRFNLGTNRKGASRLEIFDSDEKVIWKAP